MSLYVLTDQNKGVRDGVKDRIFAELYHLTSTVHYELNSLIKSIYKFAI